MVISPQLRIFSRCGCSFHGDPPRGQSGHVLRHATHAAGLRVSGKMAGAHSQGGCWAAGNVESLRPDVNMSESGSTKRLTVRCPTFEGYECKCSLKTPPSLRCSVTYQGKTGRLHIPPPTSGPGPISIDHSRIILPRLQLRKVFGCSCTPRLSRAEDTAGTPVLTCCRYSRVKHRKPCRSCYR